MLEHWVVLQHGAHQRQQAHLDWNSHHLCWIGKDSTLPEHRQKLRCSPLGVVHKTRKECLIICFQIACPQKRRIKKFTNISIVIFLGYLSCGRATQYRRTGRSPPSPAGSPPACTEPRSSPCTPDRTAPCRAPGPAGSPDPGSSLSVEVAWIEHRRGSRGGLRASELRRKLQTSGCSLSQGIVGKFQCTPEDQIYISRIGAIKQTSLRTPGSWSSRRRLRSHVASPLTSNMATSASLGAL